MKTLQDVIQELQAIQANYLDQALFCYGWDDGSIIVEDKNNKQVAFVETK